MRRREFITILGGAAAGLPVATRAEQSMMPFIGLAHAGSANAYAKPLAGFRMGLAEEGFREDNNVVIDYRWANGHYEAFSSIIAEFLREKVAVIVTMDYANATKAALRATNTIPIVFATATDPVATGLVTSINRPSGNATGITYFSNSMISKRLELLNEIAPGSNPIGLLLYREHPLRTIESNAIIDAARQLRREIVLLEVSIEPEIDTVVSRAHESGIQAILMGTDAYFSSRLGLIAGIAIRNRMATAYWLPDFPAAGGLMSYGVDRAAAYHDVGRYVGRLLAGSKISDLPVLQPSRFSLVVNLKTAKEIEIEIPPKIIALADEVIE